MHKSVLVDEKRTILFEAGPDPARLLDKYYTCSMSADVGLAVGKAMEGRYNYCELERSLSIDSFVYFMDCMTTVYTQISSFVRNTPKFQQWGFYT